MTSPAEVDEIRWAVRSERDGRSARAVAREIGMSAAGLRHFLRGGRPYHHTMGKLRRWHALYLARSADAGAPAVAEAIASLVRLLPPAVRAAAPALLLDAVRKACTESGAPLPAMPALAAAAERWNGAGPLATQAFRPAAPRDMAAVRAPLPLPMSAASG